MFSINITVSFLSTSKMERGPVKRAVHIGINYYGSENQLAGCQDDVDDLEAYLKNRGYTEITILKDDENDTNHELPTCPTKDNILATLKKAIADTKSGDTLFVQYSGHGSQLDDQNGDEKDGQDECICPVDFDWNKTDDGFIRDDDLHEILVKGLPAGAKLRVLFDSCHSGSCLDLPLRYDEKKHWDIENDEKLNKDIVFFSGCKDDQTSADSSFNGRPNGAVTWSFLQALGDMHKSGKSHTWQDLIQSMRAKLMREGYDQIPQLDVESKSQLKSKMDLH